MLSAILTRYPTVKGIEVYNEFNTNTFNQLGCQTGACFAPMLSTSYHQIKADHPNALVAGPSTSGLGRAMPFINDLWNAGGLDNVDVVSVHPYTYPAAPEGSVAEFQQLNQSVRDHNGGQTKPIWVTENGWPNGTHSNGVDEATTADNLIRSEALAFANGVTQYDWYDLVNDGTNRPTTEHNFGLMRLPTAQVTAVSPKPALVTQAVTIRQLAGLAFSGRRRTGRAAVLGALRQWLRHHPRHVGPQHGNGLADGLRTGHRHRRVRPGAAAHAERRQGVDRPDPAPRVRQGPGEQRPRRHRAAVHRHRRAVGGRR